MANETSISPPAVSGTETERSGEELSTRKLSEAAKRALAEAQERRLKAVPSFPPEINGRKGPEPVRYGDWEVNGMASDF